MFTHRLDDRTELRPIEERYADEIYAVVDANRDYLRLWLPWVDNTRSVDDVRTFIRSSLERQAANNGFNAPIFVDGRVAGVIGFHPPNWPNRRASIGYWLAEAHQGRGIMTRACRALVDHAFHGLQLNRVEIECAVENHRSRAIPQRLGFREEGVLRQREKIGDRYLDLVMYGIVRVDWREPVGGAG